MKTDNSAIASRHLSLSTSGLLWGLIGIAGFSLTTPLTRLAVHEGLSATFVGAARGVVAAALAAVALVLTRQPAPRGRQWIRVAVVAAGIVVGFSMFSSYALAAMPASHAAVILAVLPTLTAVFAALRTGERPPRAFWWFTGTGMVAAIGFAVVGAGSPGQLGWPDLLLFGAVLAAAIGYAEGGLLARELGAWQTVCWALLIAAPVMAAITTIDLSIQLPRATAAGWASFGYLCLVSMFGAYVAWYRGLAIGPMVRVSQVQLVQPVLSIGWAALLLGERLTWATVVGAAAVIACAAAAVRVRFSAAGR